MLFMLAMVIVPAGMIWQIIWTLRHGRLPSHMLLRGVTRENMPIAFWLFVVGLSFATAIVVAVSASFVLAALPSRA